MIIGRAILLAGLTAALIGACDERKPPPGLDAEDLARRALQATCAGDVKTWVALHTDRCAAELAAADEGLRGLLGREARTVGFAQCGISLVSTLREGETTIVAFDVTLDDPIAPGGERIDRRSLRVVDTPSGLRLDCERGAQGGPVRITF